MICPFSDVFVKKESSRIRVHSQPLYLLSIIIKYNLHLNIRKHMRPLLLKTETV